MGSYAEMKKANPDFPILVREASGTEAKLIARYGECTALVKMAAAVVQPKQG